MDEEKKSSGGFMPSQGLLWVAAIAAGAFFIREAPLQGSRPAATDPKPYSYLAPQDIDARLWQDPLTAISRGRADIRKRYARSAEAERTSPRAETARPSVPVATEQTDHDPSKLAHDIEQRTEWPPTHGRPLSPLVLGVMVQGGSYAESIESRRRARYAVLAGLQQMGYAPDDSAHIGYLLPSVELKATEGLPEFIAYEWFVGNDGGTPVLVLWLDEDIFANETVARLHALRDALRQPPSGRRPAVFDIDVQFAVVGPGYGSTLHDMANRVTETAPDDGLAFYAYGASVDQQRVLAGTPLQAKGALYRNQRRRDWEPEQRRGDPYLEDLNLLRTIGDDASLAVALKDELSRRGIKPGCNARGTNPKQHVVLIAESDTFRGRSLPALVERQYRSGPSVPATGAVVADGEPTGDAHGSDGRSLDCPGREKQQIHRYTYLRGLDGQLPAREDAADADAKKSDAEADPSHGGSRTEVQRQIERPEGQAQVDYLRRLSVQLVDLDRRWRSDGESIQAIGVLGSDVFDKLLILQALRPQFRGAIFFTTDLDARLLHPQEQDWARNLVVASSFGLTLRPELQRDVPPFRDGLETSIYLSTLIALHNAKQECGLFNPGCDTRIDADDLYRWVQQPRIFEVGRTEAFDFSARGDPRPKRECGLLAPRCDNWTDVADITRWGGPPPQPGPVAPEPSSDPPGVACEGASSLKACSDIQPPGTALFLSPGTSKFYAGIVFFTLIAIVLAVATGLVARVLLRWRKGEKAAGVSMLQWVGRSPVDFYACAAVVVVALVVLALPLGLWQTIAAALTEHGDGEPMSLTAGVSIWPGEMIRVAAILLSAFFIYESWWQLDANLRLISQKLAFEPTYEAMRRRVEQDYAGWTRTQRFFRAISFLLIEYAGGPPQARVDLTWSAQLFWKKYLYQGRFWARVPRVMLAGTAYFVVSAILVFAFGVPNTPYRGHVAQVVDRSILGLSLLITLFVIFFVVDATVFCCQVIKALRDDVLGEGPNRHVPAETRWASSTLQHYKSRLRIHPRYIDAWILIDFIALRTEAVSKLVYFPFIVTALMALSRDRAFDNWTMPFGLLMVFAVNVTIVAVCAVLLRRSAEKTRERVLELLSDDLIRLKSRHDANVDQLEAMAARVRGIAVGAFAPYSQQPILRAVLALLTALGGPALLDYLNLTGI